jgi:beta-barrel assembly-enhancing protease
MARYDAHAFHSQFDNGKSFGSLETRASGILFRDGSGAEAVELPYQALTIRTGGAGDRLLFLTHPSFPDWSIYTTDHSILNDPDLHAHEHLLGEIAGVHRGRRSRMAVFFAFVLLMIGAVIGLVQMRGPIASAVARQVPPRVEERIGAAAMTQITAQRRLITDEAVLEPMHQIVARIETSIPEKRYTFRLYVVDDPAINAFALPGGHIALHSGLITRADSVNEIAGVLAHEMAHVTEQHSLEQILSTIGMWAILQSLLGDASALVAVVAEGGARVLTMSFSRAAEREADDVGFVYLERAGIDPRGMVNFFGKLLEQEKELAGGLPRAANFLSTHPTTLERIERLEGKLAGTRRREWQPLEIDLEQVKGRLRE